MPRKMLPNASNSDVYAYMKDRAQTNMPETPTMLWRKTKDKKKTAGGMPHENARFQ